MNAMMNQLCGTSLLFGGNAPFVEELYENYLDNPASVPGDWRDYFDKLAQLPGVVARDVPHLPVVNAFAKQALLGGYRATLSRPVDDKKQVSVLQLITAYRTLGARWANLDPLKRQTRPVINELDPAFYGLDDADINTPFNAGSFKGPEAAIPGTPDRGRDARTLSAYPLRRPETVFAGGRRIPDRRTGRTGACCRRRGRR